MIDLKLTRKEGKLFDRIFEIGVLIKALFGFFELCGGILFAISGQKIMNSFIIAMAEQEILTDPNDFVANYLVKLSNDFSLGTQIFASSYLIFHGIVNIFLAVFLLKGRIWAYPAAILLFGIFLIYQIYRYLNNFSFMLLFLIVFDIIVISVIFFEYGRHKKRLI
jgi:uncharacterized membrane protein